MYRYENLTLDERKEISNIFTEKYYQLAYFNGNTYVCYLILKLFRELGVLEILKNKPNSSLELIERCNFSFSSKLAIDWMLAFLAQEGFLKKTEELYFYQDIDLDFIDLKKLKEETIKSDKEIIPSINLIDYVFSEYPNFLFGYKNGLQILFEKDKVYLWLEYFSNKNSGYRVHNQFGSLGVLKWAINKEKIRILEIGGGTASATVFLIEKLKEKNLLCKIDEYIFSDISPFFLRIGNRAIMEKVGDDFRYSLKRIDFNKPFTEQGISKNSVDLVYGTNALHIAKDLVNSLKNIYDVIKNNGLIILSESCRETPKHLLFNEVIFCLLDNYVNVNLDKNLRPIAGFLDWESWKKNLELAGFRNIEALYNTDGFYLDNLKNKIKIIASVIKGEKLEG